MRITVCICTRNCGVRIRPTLESVFASSYPDFDLLIVDQSVTNETEQTVAALQAEGRQLIYIRTRTTGLSVARNIAVAHARGPLLAFTDDDCEVAPDWLTLIARHFAADARAGEICGSIRAAPHDASQVYSPALDVPRFKRVTAPWRRWGELGAGGNMAFRRTALAAAGPFDEALGAGAVFGSGEDIDMSHRVLRAGYSVLNVADAYVIHHGAYAHQAIRDYVLTSEFAAGAAYMKHLRLGDFSALPVLLHRALGCITWRKLLLLRRESGVTRTLSCIRGMLASLRYPVSHRTRTFVTYLPRPAPPQRRPFQRQRQVSARRRS